MKCNGIGRTWEGKQGEKEKTHIEIGTVPSSMRLPHKLVRKWKLFEWEHLSACKCLRLYGRSEWRTHTHTHARASWMLLNDGHRVQLKAYNDALWCEFIWNNILWICCATLRTSPLFNSIPLHMQGCTQAHTVQGKKEKTGTYSIARLDAFFLSYFNLYLWRNSHYYADSSCITLLRPPSYPQVLLINWSHSRQIMSHQEIRSKRCGI